METMILNVLYVCKVALILVRRSWGVVGGIKIRIAVFGAISRSDASDREKVRDSFGGY